MHKLSVSYISLSVWGTYVRSKPYLVLVLSCRLNQLSPHKHTCTHTRTHTHTHMYVCAHTHTHTHTHTHLSLTHTHTHTHMYVCAHTHTHLSLSHTHTHTCTYACTREWNISIVVVKCSNLLGLHPHTDLLPWWGGGSKHSID